ncbi:MAG: 2-dehydropantoate 2-reductase [Alphaproteobacteria bacterium]|nr:2-dehydropantoate 2-reductase [Alphaproteobacteria bacterium]|tara:strand:+ start:1005 stop:1979 length:975 start_codon:yes stop_codon:yes gene_type:complete
MKICIVGAGAIGGFLGARLAISGFDVSMLARGPHLIAMKENGVTLTDKNSKTIVKVPLSDDPSFFGTQDFVILTLKSPSLENTLPTLQPLFDNQTTLVTAMNGIPWWFFECLEGPLRGHQLETIDFQGKLASIFSSDRIIGCVVHAAAAVDQPGIIKHVSGDLFIVGEADKKVKTRTVKLHEAINSSNLKSKLTEDIHGEIWSKLLGNMAMGPISTLTKLSLSGIAYDPDARSLCINMIEEAQKIGDRLGLPLKMSASSRIDLAAELGDFKPSILQDLEKKRPMEIDALIGVVRELGELLEIPTPTINTVLSLQRAQARFAGLV